ncbi:MAG: hypothetical protein Aurels2KO_39820 [Aureliella sp.]
MRFDFARSGLLLLALSICTAAHAESPRSSSPPLVRGTADEVDINESHLEQAISIVRDAVANDEIPSAVVLVARRGKVVALQAFGHRDFERSQPLEPDALFRMASNSKAVTSAGIMLLVDDGIVDLDASVGTYLPAFDNDAWRRVTIRHLLTHTSGCRIKPLFFTPLLKPSPGDNRFRLVREVERFAEIAPEAAPGTTYSYNNAGFNILAGVIEQVTGSYKEHLRQRLYEPLGMTDSCNHESDADHDRMSTVMRRQKDGSWKAGWTPGDAPDWPFPRGSGGMVSTAWDYALFCQMHLSSGRHGASQVLSASAIQEMTTPQFQHCPAAKSYGLGWKVTEAGGTYSHTGSDGTFVFVNPRLELIGMLLTQTTGATRPREAFRQLVERACEDDDTSSDPLVMSASTREPDGFYKDIFMSSGKNLTSRKTLHAADSLGLSYEYYAGSDAVKQNQILTSNKEDENGVLLYPDGEPRFRMIYVNGGAATAHGKSLQHSGRERIRNFYNAGGSYCGSCAGSFFSGRNVDQRAEPREGYLHIFPYNTLNTGLKKARLKHTIPHDSPLLRYRDFGADYLVPDIYHNNGNWLSVDATPEELPGIEVLARYAHPDHKIDNGAAIWAYQAVPGAGRIVNIGSHPEGKSEGEALALTEASFLYALDGAHSTQLKSMLLIDQPRVMNRSWKDGQPEFAKIGDRQYHHFAFDLPATQTVEIELSGEPNVDLHLFMSDQSLAFRSSAGYFDTRPGSSKKFRRSLAAGRWYISVFCDTTVETINDSESGFHRYITNQHILNGTAYQITIGSTAP